MIDFENNYIVNNLNPDFDLSRYYHRDLLASDWPVSYTHLRAHET